MNQQVVVPLETVIRKKSSYLQQHSTRDVVPEVFNHIAVERFIKGLVGFLRDNSSAVTRTKVLIKDQNRTCHRKRPNQLHHELTFGLKTLEHFWAKGVNEYRSIRHRTVLYGPKCRGWQAIYYTVLHEFAHAEQWHAQGGERQAGNIHNKVFVDCLNRLLTVYTFGEISNRFLGR